MNRRTNSSKKARDERRKMVDLEQAAEEEAKRAQDEKDMAKYDRVLNRKGDLKGSTSRDSLGSPQKQDGKGKSKPQARAGGFEDDDDDEVNDRLSLSASLPPQEIKMGDPRYKNKEKHEPVPDNKYTFKGKAKETNIVDYSKQPKGKDKKKSKKEESEEYGDYDDEMY